MPHMIGPSPSIVVGIDGSRSALTAVRWAVQEATARDVPLRLISAIDDRGGSAGVASHPLFTVRTALRQAVDLVKSANQPVGVDVQILPGRPTEVLLDASRGAAMLCIGAVGTTGATSGRLGSTAAGLATRTQCPLAIIRGSAPSRVSDKAILVELDPSPEGDTALHLGITEALQRHAPLVVVSAWQAEVTDPHDTYAVAEQNRQVRAEINRRLACTLRHYPALEVTPVAVHGTLLNYLSRHAQSIQLVLVGRRRAHGVAEMIGPTSYAALHDTDCSVMVCAQHGAL